MKNKEPKTRVYYMKDEMIQGVCPICNRIVSIIISHKEKEILGICGECGGTIFYSDESTGQKETLDTLNINDRMD